ncbi:uncharacterized protein N7459_002042 [Penicillium hispanicum]|uniref:uncharacterized protein n=1 Tax=Penicillium hispanicum TaxID=1080232 RepID=UPI002541EF1D|nr:uncharacterized protein N7459_002042 [Penicillium hispanicum]KAJ5591673.1 hypothetical protein N7459_002042 [Penicillium hispanicum]
MREADEILTGSNTKPWAYDVLSWGHSPQRLIAESYGDFAVAVETNVGAWLCVIEESKFAETSVRDGLNQEAYDAVWTNGCLQSLKDTLRYWNQKVQDLELENYQLHTVGVQVDCFGVRTGRGQVRGNVPVGYAARQRLVPELEQLLQVTGIPLLGWPVLKNKQKMVSFVIEQKQPTSFLDGGFPFRRTVVNVYGTGTGPSDDATKRNPEWGASPAVTINLSYGVPENCGDSLIYIYGEKKDAIDYPSADAQQPQSPYAFIDVN